MQLRPGTRETYDSWWKDANQDFLARKIALVRAQEWARRMERKIQAYGSMIELEIGALQSNEDPHAFRDAVFFLMDCWAYGPELERQIRRNPRIRLNYSSYD